MTFNPNTDIDPAWITSTPEDWPEWASGGDPGTLLLGPPAPIPKCGGGPAITVVPAWEKERQEQCQWTQPQPPPPGPPPGAIDILTVATSYGGSVPSPSGTSGGVPDETMMQNAAHGAYLYGPVTYTFDTPVTSVTMTWDLPTTAGTATWNTTSLWIPTTPANSVSGWFIPEW